MLLYSVVCHNFHNFKFIIPRETENLYTRKRWVSIESQVTKHKKQMKINHRPYSNFVSILPRIMAVYK